MGAQGLSKPRLLVSSAGPCSSQPNAQTMADVVTVCVSTLAGQSLEHAMQASDTIGSLREHISSEWGLEAGAFRLLSGVVALEDTAEIQSLEIPEDEQLSVTLVNFDPLPSLGVFDVSRHRGIKVTDVEG